MRIAIFSDVFYPELSGISDSLITLAKELAKRGHKIVFCAPQYSKKDYALVGQKPQEPDFGPNISFIRFPSFSYPTGTNQGRGVIPTGSRLLRIKKFNPDIIHTQLFFGVGLEAIFAARMLTKPVVGTNHTALKEFLKYSPIRSQWFAKALLKYMNWYYERCELVTAPAPSILEGMREMGSAMPPEKMLARVEPTLVNTWPYRPASPN